MNDMKQRYPLNIALYSMKLTKLSLILILFFCGVSHTNGQFYKRLSAEIGINKAKTFNTGIFYPNQFIDEISVDRRDIKTQTPAITTNYSLSLGLRLSKNHSLRIRHSRNSLGNYLTGDFGFFGMGGFCGVGVSPIVLQNRLNKYTNSTIGMNYEFQLPIYNGSITFGIGYEKQWNSHVDSFILFPGVSFENYAVHSSIGLLVPIYSIVHLHTKFFFTRTIENNSSDNWLSYHHSEEATFIPVQIGLELGLRFDFYPY